MSSFENFQCEYDDDVCIATCLIDSIEDEMMIEVMGNQLYYLVEEEGKTRIILDFSRIEVMGCAFLGKLIRLNNKAKEAFGRMVVCGIQPDVYEVFAITKLNKVFHITDTVEQARAKVLMHE